jgi:hypothetical protein
MLKDFIGKQTAFNKSVEEKLGKIDSGRGSPLLPQFN